MKKIGSFLLLALVTSGISLLAIAYFDLGKTELIVQEETTPSFKYVNSNIPASGELADFTGAAERSTVAVVHIRATKVSTVQSYDPWRDLFGDDFFRSQPNPGGQQRRSQSSGSGVVINENGYIVTNNHVIADAEELEVTLWNQEKYKGTVVGTDPSTDLALIKIEAEELPQLSFANSDEVRVGEWVLAVGNPFNLESTVTAGIVSAKGRNINILKDQYSIESFIQTDAAVNPGNSGGALVDLNGNLIGINTAIATPTGVYAGYSFAVPANIVKKVCEDLKNYGVVQRGFLGVMIRNVDGNVSDELDLNVSSGVYIDNMVEDGAAQDAGLEIGDVIVGIDNRKISTVPELQEAIGSKRPGDKVGVTVIRDGEEVKTEVVLRNKEGNTELVEKPVVAAELPLGIKVKSLTETESDQFDVDGGVKVTEIGEGHLKRHTRIREGFVITKIDGTPINSKKDFDRYFEKKNSGGGMIEGFYPGIKGKVYYAYGLD